MGNAVQQRLGVLERFRVQRRGQAAHARGLPALFENVGRHPALFHRAHRQHARWVGRGFSQPRVTMTGRDQSIADVAQANGEANPFYAPFKQMPATLPADVQAQLRQQAVRAIDTQVVPAYARLLDFIRNEYQRRARTTLAAEALPDGQAYYRAQIRVHHAGFEPRSDPSDRLAGSGQAP
nr:DUF885 family protein [Xanthomonas oryzae]